MTERLRKLERVVAGDPQDLAAAIELAWERRRRELELLPAKVYFDPVAEAQAAADRIMPRGVSAYGAIMQDLADLDLVVGAVASRLCLSVDEVLERLKRERAIIEVLLTDTRWYFTRTPMRRELPRP